MTNLRLLKLLRLGQRPRMFGTATAAAVGDDPVVAKKTGKKIPRAQRKTMVEDYVNKFRESNGGKFPGVGSTKKHVGGDHYIIRGILQELYYDSKLSAVATANKSSTTAHTTQDNSSSVKESVSSEMLDGKVAKDQDYGDSGDTTLRPSMDTSLQPSINLLEEPGLEEKTSPDSTMKATSTEDSKSIGMPDHLSQVPDNSSTGFGEGDKSSAQAYEYNRLRRNTLATQGAEEHLIPQVGEMLDDSKTTNADDTLDSTETGITSEGEVISGNVEIKVDTLTHAKTINASVEEVSANDSHVQPGLGRTSSVSSTVVGRDDDSRSMKGELLETENITADQSVQASSMDSQFSAYQDQCSEFASKAVSAELGKTNEVSDHGLKNGEVPRKDAEGDARDDEHNMATIWGNLKTIASNFINIWWKT